MHEGHHFCQKQMFSRNIRGQKNIHKRVLQTLVTRVQYDFPEESKNKSAKYKLDSSCGPCTSYILCKLNKQRKYPN